MILQSLKSVKNKLWYQTMDKKSKKMSSDKKKSSNSVVIDVDVDVDSDEKSMESSKESNTAVIKSGTKNNKIASTAKSKSKGIAPQVKRSREKHHSISGIFSPNKRNRTIEDWCNNPQTAKNIHCPACGTAVSLTEINHHLDYSCKGGKLEDNPGNSTGKLSENSQEKKPPTPLHSKEKISNTLRQNKSSRSGAKSLRDMTIDVSLVQKSKPCPNEYSTHSQNQDSISLDKGPENISIDIDDKDEDDTLEGLSKEFAKPILDDPESPKCQDNLMKVKSSPDKRMGNEKMGNEKSNKPDSYKNDVVKDMGLCYKNAQCDGNNLPNDCTLDVEDNLTEKDYVNMANESNEAAVNQEHYPDPYYLANFKLVMDTVLSNEEDRNLFNDADQKVIHQFQEFPAEAQKLYIRLFQRKPGWFRCSTLKYPEIAKDLTPVLNILVESGFLENEKKLTDLREALHLLSADDIRDLAKALHLIPKSGQQKKQHIIECLIKHGVSQKTLFSNGTALLLRKAKEALGLCVRLSSDCKSVFSRLLLLFSMNIMPEDEENKFNGQSQQLSTILRVNMGQLLYPEYTITRKEPIFKDRDHMIKFIKAYQEKHDMFVALEETKDVDVAYSFYPKAAKCFKDVLATLKTKVKTFSSSLPVHLRCFTAEWVYTKMCFLGVEVLQKKRQYEEAVCQLELLLQQDTYCADCRGQWWERLALNVHQHLKQPVKALEIIRQGLEDSHVRFGRRLALIQRARMILSSASFKKRKNDDTNICDIDEALLVEPHPAETIKISGKRLADAKFMSPEVTKTGHIKEDSVMFVGVEEFALSYYRLQGYDEGIHGETSTFTTLYGLFFWDVLFLDGIPDVFRGKFQANPLDIKYDTFYTKRKQIIDHRLREIENSSNEDLVEKLEQSWVEHEGQICSGVSWDRFEGVEQAKQLVSCIGGRVLSGVFKHFAQDMRHWHSGMPDLVVWNSNNMQYRIIEVKGPGDRLSTKQIIWLDELASLGATVKVCYVTAVGGKKLVKAQ